MMQYLLLAMQKKLMKEVGDDAEDGRIRSAALLVLDGVPQHEVRDDEQRHDEVRGQARLPDPPLAPLEAGQIGRASWRERV